MFVNKRQFINSLLSIPWLVLALFKLFPMKSNLYFSVIAIGIIAISSCKKLDPGPINKHVSPGAKIDTDIYVTGYIYALNGHTVAVYWKNGVINRLADSTAGSEASGIALNGSDVYVSGTLTDVNSNPTAAVYWKNGVMTKLADAATTAGIGISQCGCDVYIAGTLTPNSSHYIPVYWKNGIQQQLESHSAIVAVNGMTVHGGDLYATGVGITNQRTTYALYWKNGTAFNLTDTLSQSQGNAIAVNGNDIYVVGETVQNSQGIATYWKNGVKMTLQDPNKPDGTTATGIAVKNNDTYISVASGFDGSYWINNSPTYLSNSTTQTVPKGITLYNNDVYVAGVAILSPSGSKIVAVYWKNGALVVLPTPDGGPGLFSGGAGSSIIVITHSHH